MLGDSFKVSVLEVKGGNAKFGIEAPKDVPVHRAEVAEKLRKNTDPDSSDSA